MSHGFFHQKKSQRRRGNLHVFFWIFNFSLIASISGPAPAHLYSVHAPIWGGHKPGHKANSSRSTPQNRQLPPPLLPLKVHPHRHQGHRNHRNHHPRCHPRQHNLLLVEGLDLPLAVLTDQVVTDVTRIKGDEEHQQKPADDRDEQEEDQPPPHLTLGLGVILGDPAREVGGVGEFPAVVEVAEGLFEDAAVFFGDGAALGFGAGGGGAVVVAEEGLQELAVQGEGWALQGLVDL